MESPRIQINLVIRWIIAQRQKLVEYFDRNPEESRDEQARDIYLQAIFLFARELDFGLRSEVYAQIKEDKSLFREIKREIFSFLNATSPYAQSAEPNNQETFEYYRTSFINDAIGLDSYNLSRFWREIPSILQNEKEDIENYFLLWNDAMQKHDMPAAIALEFIIFELLRKKDQGYRCLKPGLLYKPAPNTEQFQIPGFNHLIKLGDSFVLDQVIAHRDNSWIWQKVRVIIDKIINPLKDFIEELLEHLQDKLSVSDEEFSEVRSKYYCELCTIIALEWFQNHDYEFKWNFIKNPYGIKMVINCIHNLPDPLPLNEVQIVMNLLIEYGYYSEVIELVEYFLERKAEANNILDLIAIGILWTEALIELNELSKALILIRTIFGLLQDEKSENILTKLSFQIEYANGFQKIIDFFVNHSLKSEDLEKPSNEKQLYQLKLKCIIAAMKVLHTLNKPELELEFFSYIQNIVEEKKDSKLQMIGWFDLSRYFRERNEYKREFDLLIKAQSTDSYLHTPIFSSTDFFEISGDSILQIPNLIDQRVGVINKSGLGSTILQEIDRETKIWNFIKLGTDAQAMGSHRHAIDIGLKAIDLLRPSDPNQIKKQIYEILIFSYLYLYEWLNAQTYIDIATPFDKNPLYYQIYAVIVKLGQKKNKEACRLLLNIWKLMQMKLEKQEFYLPSFIEGLFHIAQFLGVSNFELFINKLCETNDFKGLSADMQALFLIDIGNFTADIGDYKFSENLYNNAFEVANDITIKADAINGIGTIKFNMGEYQESIQKYKEAISLDNQDVGYYENLANVYSETFDYQKAIKSIDKAIALASSLNYPLDELLWKKFEIVRLNSGYIHINSVKSQVAKNHLQQAEYSFDIVLKEKDLQFNANQLISELANGIDAILQEELMPHLISTLNSLYGPSPQKIPNKLGTIRAIQNMRKGIPVGLGEWTNLISALITIPINPIYQPLRDVLNRYSDSELDAIGTGSKKMAEWRNPNVHGAIISFNDYIDKRVEIIATINQIIDTIYKNDLSY